MLYWLRGREGKATGFPLPFTKDDPINCRHRRLLPEQSTTSTHMTAPMLRLELSLVITALRRSVLALVSISSQKPSSSAGGSFKRTTVARGRMGEQLSGLGSILNNQSSRDSYRCCPSKMPGATPVKWTSTVAMVVEVRSKEGMKVDEGKHRRAGNRNLFINEIFCTKAPV